MKIFRHVLILCLLFIIPWTHSQLLQFKNFSLTYRKMESMSMKLCISKEFNPVVVSNDIRNDIGESLWSKKIIPTISIAKNFGTSNDSVIFLPKFPTYILSTNELQTVLQKIKSSPWWNIKSYFFIVEVSRNCNDNYAWKILQVMWKMNLLSSLFICRDTNKTVTLYTYNPYANYAPQPWQHVNTIFNKKGQQWTLFKKSDSSGRPGCSELFFDKTKLLNGSKVVAINHYFRRKIEVAYDLDSIEIQLPYMKRTIFKEIFSALNVRPIIYYSDYRKTEFPVIQTREQWLIDMINGIFDISLMYYTFADETVDYLYPRLPDNFFIVTHHNKVPFSSEETESIFSIEVIILTVIVFAITWIVLILCKRPSIGSGLLEILRLILSTSILLKFYRSSLKIFMVSILIFVIFMNNIYQGHMSAYSTKLYREEINSITDLQNSKYTIYMQSHFQKIFGVDLWTDAQRKYVQFGDSLVCRKVFLSNNSRTACLTNAFNQQKRIEHNLRVFLYGSQQFCTFVIRNDWPLKSRVDHIMSQLDKGGFLSLWENRVNGKLQRAFKFKESEISIEYQPIVIADLYSTFLFLLFSLSISIFVFIVEVSISRLRSYIYNKYN